MDNILSFLGLAHRGNALVTGEEPVGAAARAKDARLILVAQDAAENTRRRARHFAESGDCILLSLPYEKDTLGSALGRSSVALLALTDIGFANALVQKLKVLDEDSYGAAAERMALKAERAAERQREAKQHEKNIKSGKKKIEKQTAPAKAPARPEAEKKLRSGTRQRKELRSRPQEDSRTRYAHSRPVKKGKGSVKK